jgi:polyisoprenoid-binding protein YceI
MIRRLTLLAALIACGSGSGALAASQVYTIDPTHTYPTFVVGHAGVSHWQGKFNKSSGKVWLDREHSTGKVEITIDTSSINFGFPLLDKIMQGPDYFDVARYPTATYKSDAIHFADGVPASADGELTLRGVTKPVKLTFTQFKCRKHPMLPREVCGGDATAEIDRAQFGLTKSVEEGDSKVRLTIQVEAFQGDTLPPMPPMPPGPPPASP